MHLKWPADAHRGQTCELEVKCLHLNMHAAMPLLRRQSHLSRHIRPKAFPVPPLWQDQEPKLDRTNITTPTLTPVKGQQPLSSIHSAAPSRAPSWRHVASCHHEGATRRGSLGQICGKTFKAVGQLRGQVRRHKGMRKFRCTENGSKLTQWAHWWRHVEFDDWCRTSTHSSTSSCPWSLKTR